MIQGYASVRGGKWHKTLSDRPTFMHDEQTACGLTIRPLNVAWDNPPDYAHPAYFCKHCFMKDKPKRAEVLSCEFCPAVGGGCIVCRVADLGGEG